MVEQQIRTWEVLDQDVLDLLYVVPREEFVPAQHRALAFSDMQLPLGEGERMWEPKLEARVLQELEVHRSDRVLEVGTGSGYFSALLAHRAAQVYSVELKPALAAGASLAFVAALGDFVTSILLYTYQTRPISIEINTALRVNEIGVAAAFGVVLMVVSAVVLGIGARR